MPVIRAFASHDWGKRAENHRRVARVVGALQKKGINVWFDDKDMKGDMVMAMTKGIDHSQVVLIFVTRAYLEKVKSGDDTDNVRREFMYASLTPKKLVPILFDDILTGPWWGPVGMILGSRLYVDMSKDINEKKVDELVETIQRQTGKTLWRHAAAKTMTKMIMKPPSSDRVAIEPDLVVNAHKASSGTSGTIKERVGRVVDTYGSVKGEHTSDVVDQLFVSVVGNVCADEVPLAEKLRLIEVQLGLTTSSP